MATAPENHTATEDKDDITKRIDSLGQLVGLGKNFNLCLTCVMKLMEPEQITLSLN